MVTDSGSIPCYSNDCGVSALPHNDPIREATMGGTKNGDQGKPATRRGPATRSSRNVGTPAVVSSPAERQWAARSGVTDSRTFNKP
jgi:hypothetical protein